MGKVLLVYSGGLDSSTALYANKDKIAVAVSFNYGSKHNAMEIEKAKLNCSKLGITHKVIDLQDTFRYMKSALLDAGTAIPHGHYESETMKSTVVPFRNGIMLSIAAGMAESLGLDSIMLASHKGDHAVYPDCTSAFNAGMRAAIAQGTGNHVELLAPFSELDKRQIANIGVKAGLNPVDTYSCYEGGDIHCGKCSTCVERQWSLQDVEDPTEYKDSTYWKGVMGVN